MKTSIFYSIITSLMFVGCVNSRQPERDKHITNETVHALTLSSTDAGDHINNACPAKMAEVKGNYCPEVEQKCLHWLDEDQRPEANGGIGPMRCGEFESPTKCLSKNRRQMDFCMDKFEYPGEGTYPIVGMTYYQAKEMAKIAGYRLCTKAEFNFACEGDDMHPYGYGDGFHRDAIACNIDKPWIDYSKFPPSSWNILDGGIYQGVKSDPNSKCKSIFGIYNLNGNVDEILYSEHTTNVILSGGYWGPVRTRCRPMTDSHGKDFNFYQIGFRMCNDIK